MKDKNITEIEAILRSAGILFYGESSQLNSVAKEWAFYFNHNPPLIEKWVNAGYWCPATAYLVSEEGYSFDNCPKYGTIVIEDIDPIYALCNNDISIEDLIWNA